MFRSAATVDLGGDLDEARLDALRSALRLEPEGRLDDPYDEIQGRRADEAPGGRLEILLCRTNVGGPWSFGVDVDGQPPVEVVRAVVEEVAAAAQWVGLTVAAVTWG
jgi:hypothetical protein